VALINLTVDNVAGGGGAGIIAWPGDFKSTPRYTDLYLSNVTIDPHGPVWKDYTTTNTDGMTIDDGWTYGHMYLNNVTIRNWSDAAIDVKPGFLNAVGLHTIGNGWNTLKLWWPGPHYIVDSTINNDRWASTPNLGSDGGLIWSWDCSKLEIRIWNSTFNGSATLPRDRITCEVPGTPKIIYLTKDPRTTGEMHPMF
jgi:hypothetical protein